MKVINIRQIRNFSILCFNWIPGPAESSWVKNWRFIFVISIFDFSQFISDLLYCSLQFVGFVLHTKWLECFIIAFSNRIEVVYNCTINLFHLTFHFQMCRAFQFHLNRFSHFQNWNRFVFAVVISLIQSRWVSVGDQLIYSR